jgi:taurine dioxygenase
MSEALQFDEVRSLITTAKINLPRGVTVKPTDGPVGTIVEGLDLQSDLTGEEIYSLLSIFNHSGITVFRGQDNLTPERQCEFTRWFGKPFARGNAGDKLPMIGELPLQLLSNRDTRKPGKQVIAQEDDPHNSANQALGWHSDVQDYEVPPDVTVLHGVEVPPQSAGGNTYFVSMYQAYDELDAETQAQILNMKWRPASTYATMKGVKQRAAMDNDTPVEDSPVEHPVVRTHPVTGRRALWITPGFSVSLVGFDDNPDKGEALLTRLKAHIIQPHLIYTHKWEPHDVLCWDNRCVMHARDTWDRSYLREMRRSQAGGSRPF